VLRALKYYWPFLSYAVFLAAISSYFGSLDEPNCKVLLGYSASLWALILFCFGLPLFVVVGSIYSFHLGWHSIKQGVYPPSNIPFFGLKTRTGWVAKVLALSAISCPVLALGTVVLGTSAFNEILGDNDMQASQTILIKGCDEHVPGQSSRAW